MNNLPLKHATCYMTVLELLSCVAPLRSVSMPCGSLCTERTVVVVIVDCCLALSSNFCPQIYIGWLLCNCLYLITVSTASIHLNEMTYPLKRSTEIVFCHFKGLKWTFYVIFRMNCYREPDGFFLFFFYYSVGYLLVATDVCVAETWNISFMVVQANAE